MKWLFWPGILVIIGMLYGDTHFSYQISHESDNYRQAFRKDGGWCDLPSGVCLGKMFIAPDEGGR